LLLPQFQPFFLAFLRKLVPVVPQAFGDPPCTRLDVLTEFQDIIMACFGCLSQTFLHLDYFILARSGQFAFMVLQTFRYTSSARLDILAELSDVPSASAPSLSVNIGSKPEKSDSLDVRYQAQRTLSIW
jgi:hypothetical protein